MGNSLRITLDPDSLFDGGRLRAPPDSTSTGTSDYDEYLVSKLIMSRCLAPFYEGKTESSTREDNADESIERDADSFSETSVGESSKNPLARYRRRRKFKKKTQNAALKNVIQNVSAECPICMLFYPRNINIASCCKKPICTNCFVNIRKPPSGRVISCPFCNYANFSIFYLPPKDLLKKDQNGGIKCPREDHKTYVESVKIYRPSPPTAPPSEAYRNAVIHNQRYVPYAGPPFSVRSGPSTTTYGGMRILYDERGLPVYVPAQYATPPATTSPAAPYNIGSQYYRPYYPTGNAIYRSSNLVPPPQSARSLQQSMDYESMFYR